MCKYQCITFSVLLTLVVTLQASSIGRRCNVLGDTLFCEHMKGRFLPNQNVETINNIYIIKSDITEIRNEDFSAFRDLTSLHMTASFSIRVQELTFETLPNLRDLTISHCNVSEEIGIVFSNNRGITDLNLAGNKISVIKDNFFSNLYELETLDLSNNTIFVIEENVFNGLDSLKSINLAKNRLTEIKDGYFLHLKKLEEIDMSGNEIEHIDVGAFEGLNSLHMLNLSANKIGANFNPSFLYLHFPQKCAVCKPREDQETCSQSYLNHCNNSRSIDQLWTKFLTKQLYLQNNPICKIIVDKTMYPKVAGVSSQHEVESDQCEFFDYGKCFRHESRRYFLIDSCGLMDSNNLVTDNYIPTVPGTTLPTKNVIPQNSVESSTSDDVHGIQNTDLSVDSTEYFPDNGMSRTPQETSQPSAANPKDIVKDSGFEMDLSIIGLLTVSLLALLTSGLFIYGYQYIKTTKKERVEEDHSSPSPEQERMLNEETIIPMDSFNQGFESGSQEINASSDLEETPRSIAEIENGEAEQYNRSPSPKNVKKLFLESAKRGDVKEITTYLAKGVDFTLSDDKGNTALHLAAQSGHLRTVREILFHNTSTTNIRNVAQETPLHVAVRGGHVEVVKHLLKSNANPDDVNTTGERPIHFAAFSGNIRIVNLLRRNKADIRATNLTQDTALHFAAKQGHVETVKLLLKAHAHPNAPNMDKNTPVHLAVMDGNLGSVKILLKLGGKVDVKNKYGDTPVHMAAWNGRRTTLGLLLDNGGKSNTDNDRGQTPLMNAALKGHLELMKLLVERGAKMETNNKKGNTALFYASREGHVDVVKLLLEYAADVNAENYERNTPLHAAVQKNHEEAARLLISHGADIDAANCQGETPREISRRISPLLASLVSRNTHFKT